MAKSPPWGAGKSAAYPHIDTMIRNTKISKTDGFTSRL